MELFIANMTAIKFSIIIPTYNRKGLLEECLESIYGQDMPKNEYEVIVVDDGSTDNTEILLERYASKENNFQFIKQKNQGMFAAINAVVDKTSAEYIVITDSDCILAKDFLTQMKKAVLNKKDVAAFVGNVIRNSKNYFFKSITGYEKKQRDADADKIYSQLSPKVNFHTDSCVFRKDVFREMHGFAETLLRGGADTDFGFRLIKAGYGIGFVARALVYHYERNSITDLFKRYYNFGRWDCLNYREHFKNRLIIYLPFNKMYYFPFFWSGYIRLGHFECLTFIFLLAFYVPLWSLGLLLAYILIIGKIVSNLKIFVPLTVFRYISGAGYFFGNLSQSIKCIARSPLLKA